MFVNSYYMQTQEALDSQIEMCTILHYEAANLMKKCLAKRVNPLPDSYFTDIA